MGRNKDFARVEVRLPPDIKEAAEIRALMQGYASLAAMLTVLATELAADSKPEVVPALPVPESLISNHPHIQPQEIYLHKPDLYKYYIDAGVFRPKLTEDQASAQ